MWKGNSKKLNVTKDGLGVTYELHWSQQFLLRMHTLFGFLLFWDWQHFLWGCKAYWTGLGADSKAATADEGQAMMEAAEGEEDSGLVGLPVVGAGSWD